ncbi:MAG TPA: preprotein translocase subunit YajC [Thermoanaerobaculia bacterium]|nr:preprotein translocase subunit YajC [Thermoanaerobaculia bacterium]
MTPSLAPFFALAQSQAPPIWIQFAPLAIIFAIFYFVAIAPMRKRQQELQRTIEALTKGDRVITNGGLYGEVVAVEAGTVILKIADTTKVRVAKSAIAGLQPKTDQGTSQ